MIPGDETVVCIRFRLYTCYGLATWTERQGGRKGPGEKKGFTL